MRPRAGFEEPQSGSQRVALFSADGTPPGDFVLEPARVVEGSCAGSFVPAADLGSSPAGIKPSELNFAVGGFLARSEYKLICLECHVFLHVLYCSCPIQNATSANTWSDLHARK